MAIIRCAVCGLQLARTKRTYHATPVNPVGYPKTAAICGTKDCQNSGQVWLENFEYAEYANGERIFSVKTNTVKIRVE